MTAAILVAAGKGTRMGPDVDKLFLPLAGRPVLAHAWAAFDAAADVDEIILVVRAGMEEAFRETAAEQQFQKPFRLTPGGRERQDSVWNGLQALDPRTALVAIHDAARPCVTPALITATLEAARAHGAAVAAQRVTDTIKESADGQVICAHPDRARLWAVQTPQTFRVEVIRHALAAVRERGLLVTDDTASCELTGQPVHLVACATPNPKVTQPADLPWIAQLLAGR